MRSGIASAFWKLPRRRLPARALNASLDDIAKQSGVGPGTLYRHFPTREELLQAVYRSGLEKLAAAERKFAQTHAADRSVASLAAVVR